MLIIFDCDGVLVETEALGVQVLHDCLQERGIHVPVDGLLDDFRGKSIAACVSQVKAIFIAANHSAEDMEKEASDFWAYVQVRTLDFFDRGVESIPGVTQVLQRLQQAGINFVVASNGKHEKMRKTLGNTGLLPFFTGRMFSATDVAAGKPAPDLFLYAAQSMGVEPERCIVIEDSPPGARAAHAAGMKLVGYCPWKDPDIDAAMHSAKAYIIRHMDDLLPALRQQFGLELQTEGPKS